MIFFVFFTVSILFFCLHNYFNSGTYLTCVLLTACRTLVTSLDESVYWLFTGLNCHLFVIKEHHFTYSTGKWIVEILQGLLVEDAKMLRPANYSRFSNFVALLTII